MAFRNSFYYDHRGNLTCVLDPENGLTYYAYDADRRMTSVENPWGEVTYYEYSPGGQTTQRVLGNGCVTYYSYDATGQTTKVDNRKSDLSVISSFEYERDAVGNHGPCIGDLR
jgi:YD repeat-containing protein